MVSLVFFCATYAYSNYTMLGLRQEDAVAFEVGGRFCILVADYYLGLETEYLIERYWRACKSYPYVLQW